MSSRRRFRARHQTRVIVPEGLVIATTPYELAARAHALLQAVDGRWVMIEAAPLEGTVEAKITVTLRAATASETFDFVCRAYALSRREREVVALLVAGLDTRAVTKRLFISRHTVQDHLKSVFEKIGIHSRRELLATFSASADGRRHEPVQDCGAVVSSASA
jgi:DNA-binding CsgD family transcriptional regulator